jgi:predicted membrane metal-binding protein
MEVFENKHVMWKMYTSSGDIKITKQLKDLWYYSDAIKNRAFFKSFTTSYFNDEELQVAMALIAGSNKISPTIIRAICRCCTHILSVSGLHMSFMPMFYDIGFKTYTK